jgi:hypothetical protein
MKLTDWYKGHQKPARIGVYERENSGSSYSHWNGKRWGNLSNDPDDAIAWKKSPSFFQSLRWRGLAADPQKSGDTK